MQPQRHLISKQPSIFKAARTLFSKKGHSCGNSVSLVLTITEELNAKIEKIAEESGSTKDDVLKKAFALFDVASRAAKQHQRIAILDGEENILTEIVGI